MFTHCRELGYLAGEALSGQDVGLPDTRTPECGDPPPSPPSDPEPSPQLAPFQGAGVLTNGAGRGAPAGHVAGRLWAGAGPGHGDGPHRTPQSSRLLQPQQQQVVVVGPGVVLGVWHLADHAQHLLGGLPLLQVVLAQSDPQDPGPRPTRGALLTV